MAPELSFKDLVEYLRRRDEPRFVFGIAGAPGSGKSTLGAALVDALNRAQPGQAALFALDGYHFDDRVLDLLGRNARKGAPDTFDVGGFCHMLGRLRRNSESEIAVPVFDREIEIARAGASLIPDSVRIVVVEGNYLLLTDDPWSGVRPLLDASVMLRCPKDVLTRRLVERWTTLGLPAEGIERKLADNDLPNGDIVERRSSPPDFTISCHWLRDT